MAKDKYDTAILNGLPVREDASGKAVVEEGAKVHHWRIGKHTKGKLGKPGQIFLTEQNQKVVLVSVEKLAFKDRHDYTPMGRFTKETMDLNDKI